jgi:hypothetical protein
MRQLTPAAPRPEWQLLLDVARVSLESDRAERLRALARRPLDWDWLRRTAAAQGTTALLYWHLGRAAPESPPAPVHDELRRWFHDNACRNLLFAGELIRLLDLFAAHGVRALPFKGPTLAAQAYGNLALRQFVDLDLLVAPADLARARELLAGQGYRSGLALAPGEQDAYLASIGQMPFVRPHPPCMVELHARIAPRDFHFPLDLERLWPRLRSVSLSGKRVPALAAEDLLLVLCAHGAKHGWACLGWVCDVAELLRTHPGMGWPAVLDEARFVRCERVLLLGLLLSHEFLEAPVPDDLVRRARAAPAVPALLSQVRRQMFREGAAGPPGFRNALFHLRARERFGDGLRYALSLALTPTVADWTAFRVPAPLSFVHYLFRPVRLAGKYGRRLLGRRGPYEVSRAP